MFVSRFGDSAGWAHSVLFTAELTNFSECLPRDVVEEMRVFKHGEKRRRKDAKEMKLGEKKLKNGIVGGGP